MKSSPSFVDSQPSSLVNPSPESEDIQREQKRELYEIKGNVLLQQREFKAAIESYQKALAIEPQVELYLKLAQALNQLGYRQACVEAQYQAFLLDPKIASAAEIHRLGQALAKLGQAAAALDCYQQAIAQEATIEAYHLSLASALIATHQPSEAQTSYRKALELNPDSYDAHSFFAKNLRGGEDPLSAARHYLCLLRQKPDNAEAYVWLRYSFLRYSVSPEAKILEEVIETCHQILGQASHWISINSLLGYALSKQGKGETAVEYYRKASQHKARVVNSHLPNQLWEQGEQSQPSFIILGGFKCATTSLYNYVTAHPQVISSLEKELDFFDRDYAQGLDWYLSHFPLLPPERGLVTGEATPNYLYSLSAPERISEHFPDMKLIVLLRHPVERALSHYYFLPQNDRDINAFAKRVDRELNHLQVAFDKNPTPHLAIQNCPYLGHGLYEIHLTRWLKQFSPEQFLVLPTAMLSETPKEAVKQAFDFLGLPNHELSAYKRHKVGHYPEIPEQIRHKLEDFFAPHNQRLDLLLERIGLPAMDW